MSAEIDTHNLVCESFRRWICRAKARKEPA
jgi:hypothetical protein